jgi:SAM-dependent methyltransferase
LAFVSGERETSKFFAGEWQVWSRYGWDDPSFVGSPEQTVFHQKTLLGEHDLKGATVLDAGCGNGRYAYVAARSGANHVVGLDLSSAVDVANENLADCPNVDLVQGDIFNPPFATDHFNVVFSVGVLHHTGDTRRAIERLVRHLKPGGTLSVELYQKGNVIYEGVDFVLRGITTKLSPKQLWAASRIAGKVSKVLYRLSVLDLVNVVVRLGPNPHIIFDWYGAPIATHHTMEQVCAWYDDLDMSVSATSAKERGTLRNFIRRYIYPTDGIVIQGRRRTA